MYMFIVGSKFALSSHTLKLPHTIRSHTRFQRKREYWERKRKLQEKEEEERRRRHGEMAVADTMRRKAEWKTLREAEAKWRMPPPDAVEKGKKKEDGGSKKTDDKKKEDEDKDGTSSSSSSSSSNSNRADS